MKQEKKSLGKRNQLHIRPFGCHRGRDPLPNVDYQFEEKRSKTLQMIPKILFCEIHFIVHINTIIR